METKIGLGLISFNRPELLRQVIKSLEIQSDKSDIDFYYFQDGEVNFYSKKRYANFKQIDSCLNILRDSKLFGTWTYPKGNNFGTAIQKYEAQNFLSKKYEAFIIIEDDVILDKHFLRVMKVLLEQYKEDTKVGPVVSSIAYYSKQPAISIADAVFRWKKGLWLAGGYGLWSNKWRVIKCFYEPYYALVKNCDYRLRPHNKIYQLFKDSGYFPYHTSAQDAGMLYAVNMADRCGIYTAVPRSKHIGETGLHCTPKIQKDHGWDKVQLKALESDLTIKKFREVML